jgi:hypothetical protein
VRTTPLPINTAPRDPARAWSQTGRAAGYIAGSALLAGTVLFLLDATGLLGTGPVYRSTGAGPLVDQATFYVAWFGHQHQIVWDIIARDTILPVAYLALIITALAVRDRTGPRHPESQFLVTLFIVGGIFSILADLTFLAAAEYWRQTGWLVRPAESMIAAGQTVEGIQALTAWPEAFGFAVLACGLMALGRLCRKHRMFPAALGILAYLEASLLLGIAVTGLIPFDAGYNWLSLAAGAVVGPVLSICLGTTLGQPETLVAT